MSEASNFSFLSRARAYKVTHMHKSQTSAEKDLSTVIFSFFPRTLPFLPPPLALPEKQHNQLLLFKSR